MVKAIITSIAVVFLTAFILIFIDNTGTGFAINREANTGQHGVELSFSVLGDVHTNISNLDGAIRSLYDINPGMDALILNGDVVDQGLDEQYDAVQKSLTKNSSLLPGVVIKNIGNHEFYNYEKGVNKPSEIQGFVFRYLSFSGEEKVYHDKWIKGYHFISLGPEQGHTEELGPEIADISRQQQDWLKLKLKEGYKPGRPIFVFLHQPISGSTAGSITSFGSVKQEKELKAILSRYPEVVMFTSHTHSMLELPDKPIKQAFTVVHTGAVHNPLKPDGNGGRRPADASHGLYIEVGRNCISIKGRDFKRGTWINENGFIINLNK